MSDTTAVATHVARKKHRCSWCWQLIEPGESYKRYRWFDGSDVGTCKAHPECLEAINAAASEEGGWVEWTPGQERPAKHAALR